MFKDSNETYELALSKLQDILSIKMTDANLSNSTQEILTQLLTLRLEKRLWLIGSKESLKDLWADVRRNDTFCDFLLETTFALKIYFEEQEWKNLAKRLSESYTCCAEVYEDGNNVIDKDTLMRLPTKEDFYILLYCNPWFLVLLLFNNIYFELFEKVGEELKQDK